ncbi:MAG: toll/interleukin-1 receptor domain-containing protein [Candidatus Bathyarchaeia archaeon]
MSARKDDVEFLKKFREKVDRYLFLGFAPPTDPHAHEYDPEALRVMQESLRKRDFQELRRSLSEMIPRAKKLLIECDANPILTQIPPPAVGGPVLNFSGLDIITENKSEFQLKKSMIFDAIDRAIGVLKAAPARKDRVAPNQESYVFISHSSKDTTIMSAIRQAFDDLPLKARFLEDKPGGVPPSREIAQAVREAEALFVFFSYNSVSGDTRDWILFEIGAALANDRPIFSWKQNSLVKELPRLLEQVSRYREFEISGDGVIKLAGDIRSAAKSL